MKGSKNGPEKDQRGEGLMSFKITMPKMGLTMSKGTLGKWLKKEGDKVKKGEEILEVTTDKIANMVEAPSEGVLLKILVKEGEEVPIGFTLGVIGEPGEEIDLLTEVPQVVQETAQESFQSKESPEKRNEYSEERIKITPAARKIAREKGIDYKGVKGTGPGGRITREDIEKVTANEITAKTEQEAPGVLETIPYTGMRRSIGENMLDSWGSIPKVTHHVSVDAANLIAFRRMLNEDSDEHEKISLTDILVKIAAKALEMRPKVNIVLAENLIKVMGNINIGVAVALENGLVVPVIKDANKKSLSRVSREIKELADKARGNKIEREDISGGTFTITNLGAYGSVDWFTPIINRPESSILGIGRIVEKPAIIEGQLLNRPTLGLSFAFDHRVLDGAPAAEFLAVILKLIDSPAKALM